ncbi:PREDICTED: proline-rich protein PRCC [Populus euphratica]|uniref:Proline-rich protein PRCC n=1 Tax=Populus euphratica TaxID=75702 RepID=A0AAJ6TZI9_POPEU|nr:PREDICTED: proline-rich protein PRCC [Populus euphratica]
MDLLASYASSDEEEKDQPRPQQRHQTPASPPGKPSLFSSLPQPKSSSSLFSSLPQPKQEPASKPQVIPENNNLRIANFKEEDKRPTVKSRTSLFSSLPQPKTETLQQPTSNLTPADSNPKRVVQFKPPINRPSILDEEEDEEEKKEKERKRKKTESLLQSDSSSVKGFLSSIPAPRNSSSLGVGSLGSGSGRRSVIESEGPTSISGGVGAEKESGVDQSSEGYESYDGGYVGFDHNGGDYVNYGSYESGTDQSVAQNVGGGGYESYGGYGDSGQYGSNWDDGSVAAVAETGSGGAAESALRMMGKRRRNEMPTEIIEVKQDELIKNRPREDQVKSTGIAFGPAYQPASSKGKPSKLHKRKHQIGTLYFDMKQKETELAERRSKGFLTKAETHAKYGW